MYILTYSYLFIPTETTLSSTLPNETNYDAKSNKQRNHYPLSQIELRRKKQAIFFNMSDDDSYSDTMSTIPDPTKFARLKQLTEDMLDYELLDSAIADGNEDELVSTYNKAKLHNAKVNPKIHGDQARAIGKGTTMKRAPSS